MKKSGSDIMILSTHSFPENLVICGTFLEISAASVKCFGFFNISDLLKM